MQTIVIQYIFQACYVVRIKEDTILVWLELLVD